MKLKVHHLSEDEVYQDIARIPPDYRKNPEGRTIDRGAICRLFCRESDKTVYIILHGTTLNGADIAIDNRTRRILDVKPGHQYDFELEDVGWFGEIRWALQSADLNHRFSSRIALVSLFLGALSVCLGLFALYVSKYQ